MRLLFFFILAVVFFTPIEIGKSVDPTRAVVQSSLVWLLMGLTAEIPSTYLVHRILSRPDKREEWARLLWILRRLHLGVAVAMYFTTLFFFGWPAVVRDTWHLSATLVLDELIILLPFILGLLVSWSSFYRVEKALHATSEWANWLPMPSSREFIKAKARYHLAMLLEPLFVFAAIQGALQGYDAGWNWATLILFGLLSMMAIAWLLPWIWTKAWDTHSLPAGPRRALLEKISSRLGIRLTDLLIWNTQGQHASALLAGYLPRPRFVIFSDLLYDQLNDQELCAVFTHELAHIKHRHLWILLVYLLLSLMIWTLASWLVSTQISASSIWDQVLFQLALLGVVLLYVRMTLCDLSRKLEREADLMACLAWHDQSAEYGLSVFAAALHKVAQLNGESPDHVGWMHGSVAERTEALKQMLDSPWKQEAFSRQMLWLKTGLVAGLVSFSLWIAYAWYHPWKS
jgi:STE24 endopeptidase